MTPAALIVEKVGHAQVQDLGRPGFASLGIAANGALDQHAARIANILVGNDDGAALIEVTGSEFVVVAGADVLIAVTGAAEHVVLDGHLQPAWETLWVARGTRVAIPFPERGFRSYLAVGGGIRADRVLGSVSTDALLEIGGQVRAGARLDVGDEARRASTPVPAGEWGALFRMGARRPALGPHAVVRAIEGPDLDRIVDGRALLANTFRVRPQSNHIGLRLDCPPVERSRTDELQSRGVPIGAVEVPPTGGIIILLRGRLVTAGYPVVAVVTTESLDRLGQIRPGDEVAVAFVDGGTARAALRAKAAERAALALRVRRAFHAKGLTEQVSSA
jgi:5-oxoprolinase (ATP-hydrolysing) subunit C